MVGSAGVCAARQSWLTSRSRTPNNHMRSILSFLALSVAAAALPYEGPVMGWSSWNTYRVNISDSLIMRQADELSNLGLDSLGYRYINIDDGFFGGRDKESGRLLFHPARFPDGMKPVVDHIHALGLKAGIYSDAGANTCGNFYDNDSVARGVGLYGHDAEDACHLFSELGFDFIKVDFCGGDPKQNSDSLELDPEQRYRAIRKAIDDTGRKDVKLNICRWDFPGCWAREIASSWRVSHDIAPKWWSVKNIIGQNLYLSAYAGKGRYNDMDMLELGRGLSETEERTHFGMWCMMSSPLLIGCDLTKLPPSTLALLRNKRLIALNQSPLGLQAYVARHSDGCYVLVKDIERLNGTARAVAFYNPTDSARSVSIPFSDIQLAGAINAENLFDGTLMTGLRDSMTVALPPHGTEIFALRGETRLPRTRYEAETAYLSKYQELVNPIYAGSAYYETDKGCEGGMKVVNAGSSAGNDIVFTGITADYDCEAILTIRLRPAAKSAISVAVNGADAGRFDFREESGNFSDIHLRISLKKGDNTIRLYAEEIPMPEIDFIDVEQLQASYR